MSELGQGGKEDEPDRKGERVSKPVSPLNLVLIQPRVSYSGFQKGEHTEQRYCAFNLAECITFLSKINASGLEEIVYHITRGVSGRGGKSFQIIPVQCFFSPPDNV